MTSREDAAIGALESSIAELKDALELIRQNELTAAMQKIFLGHAYSGAARMYLDQEKALEVAVQLELHARRTAARRPGFGSPKP